MLDLESAVTAIFAQDGALARDSEHFLPRPGQTRMAIACAQTIQAGGQLVVEAGTGVGKTFAYLVPLILSGQRAIVSTATKALQDQLAVRDLPALLKVLGVKSQVAVLKGRSSYLCPHRLGLALASEGPFSDRTRLEIARVAAWSRCTESGDVAELDDLSEQSAALPEVTSTRDNCLGGQCPQISRCYVNRARDRALRADLVVTNHHLFFADQNVRESAVAELLPTVDIVVFDEAHQLNDIGVQFMGRQVTMRQLESFCRDLSLFSSQLTLGSADWRVWVADLLHAAARMQTLGGGVAKPERVHFGTEMASGPAGSEMVEVAKELRATLSPLTQLLALIADSSPDLERMSQRAQTLLADVVQLLGLPLEGHVRWVETGQHAKVVETPLDVSHAMVSLFQKLDRPDQRKSWIFTSATLGHEPTLAHFRAMCGLDDARVVCVESPFDFAAQSWLYIPSEFPRPGELLHSSEVAHLVSRAAVVLGGRTLVLTTTLRAMHVIGDALVKHLGAASGIEVLVQGQASKRELTARFLSAGQDATGGCVLVASASFWEGLDLPGDALQLVVIDKIPFLPPGDPLALARSHKLEKQGKNAFSQLHVPHAALLLKQGAGRLIRRESDRGLLVVCDVRLLKMGYGNKLLEALPPMQRLFDDHDFASKLQALTKVSTNVHCW